MKRLYPEKFDLPLSDAARQELERQLLLEKTIYTTKEELYCKGRYKNFFEHYDEETIHAFIEEYAKRKAVYILDGAQLLKKEETQQLYFRNLTENFIWEIQQKKLFDLQCLWRAEKIKIDGVEVTKDFQYLECTVKNCKLIDTISKDELQLYIDYILSGDYSGKEHDLQWQDYDAIKNNNVVPAWYNYYDKLTRVGSLLDLPNGKGEKESFYVELLEKEKSTRENFDDFKNISSDEAKPALKFNYKTLEFFVTTFEDKSFLKYFYAAEKNHPDLNSNFELEEAILLLRSSEEKIPVESNRSWKDAVLEAARYFKTKKIAETLLHVYDEYKLRMKTALPFYDETDHIRQQLILRNVEKYKKQLLAARKLNGGSADFNF